jgi:hypothetical protein
MPGTEKDGRLTRLQGGRKSRRVSTVRRRVGPKDYGIRLHPSVMEAGFRKENAARLHICLSPVQMQTPFT